jgi:peptidoglycan/LPS O-acetylase OafA/YrhL
MAFQADRVVSGTSAMRRNMPALTMMRAFLAWWVVLFHAAPLYPFGIDQQSLLLRCGVIRVDCFFVISGFVLFGAHPALIDRARPEALRSFFAARFARVYPLHLVMLCLFVLLVLGTHLAGIHLNNGQVFTVRALVNQVLLLHGSIFPDIESWNYPSWSIGAEAIAYLAAPVLFLLASRLSHREALLAMVLVGVTVIGLTEADRLTRPAMIAWRVLLEFSLGALMSRVVQRFHAPMLKVRPTALLAGAAGAAGFALLPGHGLFFAALLWMIGFLSLRSAPHTGLSGRIEAVLLYLGETAFAVYICHAFVLTLWAGVAKRFDLGLLDHPLPAAIMLCVAIQLLATSLNRFIEVPARRAIRNALQEGGRIPKMAPGKLVASPEDAAAAGGQVAVLV